MWNHFGIPSGSPHLSGSVQGSGSCIPSGFQPPSMLQLQFDSMGPFTTPPPLLMPISQLGSIPPQPAGLNIVNSFQGIPPIIPLQGLQFPTTQIPPHPVNPGIPQPGELHTGYHSMAPHQGSQFQTTQLPSYPVNSSIPQLEKMYTGYHFNQQSVQLPRMAYGMGFSSPAVQSMNMYGNVLPLGSYNCRDSGDGSGVHVPVERPSAAELPSCDQAFSRVSSNHTSAQNQTCSIQQTVETAQLTVYQMPHVANLPASGNLGHQHPEKEVTVGHSLGSSMRPECTYGQSQGEMRYRGVSADSLSLNSAKKKNSCVNKQSFGCSQNGKKRGPRKKAASREQCAKAVGPKSGQKEPDPQSLSGIPYVGQPVLPHYAGDKRNPSCADISLLATKQGAKDNVNKDHLGKRDKLSDFSDKQEMNVNTRCDNVSGKNPDDCGQTAIKARPKGSNLSHLLGSSTPMPLQKVLSSLGEDNEGISSLSRTLVNNAIQTSDNSVQQSSRQSQNACQCIRNPLMCYLHNPLRSPTGNEENVLPSQNLAAPLKERQSELPLIAEAQMKKRQNDQSVTDDTSENDLDSFVWHLLERDTDVMKNLYHSHAEQTLDKKNQPAPCAKDLRTNSHLDQTTPQVATAEELVSGQNMNTFLCNGHLISDETVGPSRHAMSLSLELRSGSDAADSNNDVDMYDHTCMVCLKTFSSRSEVNSHLSVHLKRNEKWPEKEGDDFAQDKRQEQECGFQLTLDTTENTHTALPLAEVVAGEEEARNNSVNVDCTRDHPEHSHDGPQRKENASSFTHRGDQRKIQASVTGPKGTVGVTNSGYKNLNHLTCSSDSLASPRLARKRLSSTEKRDKKDTISVDLKRVSKSFMQKNQQLKQKETASSETQPICGHVVEKCLGNRSENGKSHSKSNSFSLKSTDEQTAKSSKSCSISSSQSAGKDCCANSLSKSTNSEQRSKTLKPCSSSSRQSVGKNGCHSKMSNSERLVTLSSDTDRSVMKSQHRVKIKLDYGLHSQPDSSDLSARKSFELHKKSASIKRKCADFSDHGNQKRIYSDNAARDRKEHSSKVGDEHGDEHGEFQANIKVARSDPLRMHATPGLPSDASELMKDTKSHSKNQKSQASEHASCSKSQIHGENNQQPVVRKGQFTDDHPSIKKMKLLKNHDSTYSVHHTKQMPDTSHQYCKQNGTKPLCPEAQKNKPLKVSAKNCTVSDTSIREAKIEIQKQNGFKLNEQHHKKSKDDVAHYPGNKQEKEMCSSKTSMFAEKNNSAELHCTTTNKCDRIKVKTDKAKKIVTSLRNIFKNNMGILQTKTACTEKKTLHKKVVSSVNVTSEKGAETVYAESDVRCESRPLEKEMEGTKATTVRSLGESVASCRDLNKRIESDHEGCKSRTATARLSLETAVASNQSDGKVIKTDDGSCKDFQKKVPDDKTSKPKGFEIGLTFCVKCMTMFASRKAYDQHGCCFSIQAKKSDAEEPKLNQDVEAAIQGSNGDANVSGDTFIGSSKRTKHCETMQGNRASDGRSRNINDKREQKQKDRSGPRTVPKVSNGGRKKRKRILSYHQKKSKPKTLSYPSERKKISKTCAQRMFSCDYCNQTYSSQGGLLFHWKTVHKNLQK